MYPNLIFEEKGEGRMRRRRRRRRRKRRHLQIWSGIADLSISAFFLTLKSQAVTGEWPSCFAR